MSNLLVLITVAGYFFLLMLVSYFTSKKSNNASFFNANKKSPWYLVAFGMIGASLSGVTFISVPGWVRDSHFFYLQMVLGYLLGYAAIALILLPVYYKNNNVSIYQYLNTRFGIKAYKTGSAFFLLSRTLGAALRLFLIASVLQMAFFDRLSIPFGLTVAITIALIWLYTHKAGIKTIVWTDTLQTTFMLLAVIATIYVIGSKLNLSLKQLVVTVAEHPYSEMFNFDWADKYFFGKQFLAGAFITFVMTGLDQDMMQKNLTVRTLKESQKNMFWFSLSLLPINLLFLSLGVLLYYYAEKTGITLPAMTDEVYPYLALNEFGVFAAIVFLIGVIAAAFSSADSALTSLTTAFAVDFLNLDINKDDIRTRRTKNLIHLGVSFLLLCVILIFKIINDKSVVSQLFSVAGYTYGPLLGLFVFGLSTKRHAKDKLIPVLALLSPLLTYIAKIIIEKYTKYEFGFELLILNGAFMFALLYGFSRKAEINKA